MRQKFDVYTQIQMAEQSGQLSGPGYDINELKAAGLVVPDSSSPIGVKPSVPAVDRLPTPPGTFSTKPTFEEIKAITQPGGTIEVPEGEKIEGLTTEKLPTGITLSLSSAERQALLARQAQAACEADRRKLEPRIWKVTLKNYEHIFVEAANQKMARDRAREAGYDVQRVTWSPSYGEPKATTVSGATIKVKDGKTGDTLEFPKDSWEAWDSKYQKLVKEDGYEAAMKAFKKDYYQLADGQWLPKTDFYALPTKYADIAATKGYDAMVTAFENDHVKLGDGQWIAKSDWDNLVANDKKLGTDFAEVGKDKGYNAMVAAIDKANEPYEEFIQKVERGDIIPAGKDEYITREEFNKLPSGSQEILKEHGFDYLAKTTTIYYEKQAEPKVYFGQEKQQERHDRWAELPQRITQEEMNTLSFSDKGYYSLARESLGRAGLVAIAGFMPPAKAALPEYKLRDISAMDWGIAAAQAPLIVLGFAPAAISGSVAGRAAMVAGSTALSGMIGYGTAKNWADMSPSQRAMGVGMTTLCAVPLITTVARNVKISGPTIPTTDGQTVVWKGLSVAGHPLIGKSAGKWVLGTRGITLPEARMILNGYKPETMLETKVFVNKTALEKAGFSKTQIEYLTTTLKSRNLFAGKMSPWLDKEVLLEPTERLNAREIGTIMERLNKLEGGFIKKSKIKNAFMLYGSSTIKSQLAPELRNWRGVHDWDISLNMNQAQTEAFTQALLKDLRAKGGGSYRISPKSPTLIEKKVGGSWDHIADIHSQEVIAASAADIPASKLDYTGDYSYGRMVAEPAITVKYPGVGKLEIMRLSESGVRKADTILRVRQTKLVTPMDRYIATGGYKYGQDLVNSLAATYDMRAIPVERLSFWDKLSNRPGSNPMKVRGRYTVDQLSDLWVNRATSQIELAPTLENQGWAFSRVALHELTHSHLIEHGAVFNPKALRAFADTPAYKTSFKFIKSLSGTPEFQKFATNIGDEFMCIQMTKRMSGWYQSDYIARLKGELSAIGATKNQVNSMLKLSQMYVDSAKVPHVVPIDKAFSNFVKGTTPEYALMFKTISEFKPPERGIAQPGVPKDAADFYVTLRTFQGEAIAEEWLKSWAKAMGYSESQMRTVLPKVRKAMLDVAAQTPSSIIGYEFKPSGSPRVPVGASPSITVHVPSSLGASVSGKLESRISSPISPYKLAKSPEKQASISAALSTMVSKAPSKAISPSVARSIKASTSPKPSPSPAVSKVPSPSAKPSPSIVPNISPSNKPSLATKPSKASSPPKSTIPSPRSIPPTSPKPSPYPYPYPKPGPKPKALPRMTAPKSEKKRIRSGPALAVWKQGRYWVSIFPPFRTTGKKEDVVYSRTKPPWGAVIAKGRHSPRKTLRSIGKVPKLITVPMGVTMAYIKDGRHLTFSRRNGNRKRGRVIA